MVDNFRFMYRKHFFIAPEYRGYGVVTALYICKDAKADGFDLVEAYPFAHDENHGYHGSLSMYKKNGFEPCGQTGDCVVSRKAFPYKKADSNIFQ